jgi:hypothetical protein
VKTRWLDRHISAPGPYLALCLSEAEYLAVMRRLKVANPPPWLKGDAGATTHSMRAPGAGASCLVCVGEGWRRHSSIQVAALLVHEAVHVWQFYCSHIGEDHPGDEQEAYAIQAIAQELMTEFARRLEATST